MLLPAVYSSCSTFLPVLSVVGLFLTILVDVQHLSMVLICIKTMRIGWVWWLMRVIPALWEAEAGRSEVRS